MTSAHWNPRNMLSFDLETTGRDPHTARVVTSSLVTITGSTVSDTTYLANPGVEIPAEATAIHGISTAVAQRDGRPHAAVVADTVAGLRQAWAEERAVVIFNAPYDLTVLRTWDPGFSVDGLVIDPFVLDRALDPFRKGKRTLTALCEHYEVALDNAHNSAADSLAAARIAWKIAAKNPELVEIRGSTLMEHQAQWYRERQESFAKYLQRKGSDTSDLTYEWPLAAAGSS